MLGVKPIRRKICQRQETELEVSYQVLILTLLSQRSTNKLRYRYGSIYNCRLDSSRPLGSLELPDESVMPSG